MPIARISTLIYVCYLGLFGVLDRIQKALEKGDYIKAKELIEKGYEKEPGNPGLYYHHAQLYFTPSYEGFNADSGRVLINRSIALYEQASEEMVQDMEDDGIFQDQLTNLSEEIRDYQYGQMLSGLSIESIEGYRSHYPGSIYEGALIFKRDSIAFKRTREENEEEGYLDFLRTYPATVFKPMADSLLDELRYQRLESTGGLQDYVRFRSDYPTTNRLEEVEEYILEVSTASHQTERFDSFIRSARTERLKKKAADVLFYLSDEQTENHPHPDSISKTLALSELELFPVMDRNKFGFHNLQGGLQIPYLYTAIPDPYRCNVSFDDWVFVHENDVGKIVLKDGRILLESIEDYQSLSASVAVLEQDGNKYLYHKSGFRILRDPIEDADVFENGWIKVKREGKWGLFSVLGMPVTRIRYDEIEKLGSFWVFEREGLLGLYTYDQITEEIEQNGLSLEFKFDDLELVNDSLIIGFRDDRECMLDQDLQFVIPWGMHEIYPDQAGWYLRSAEGYFLHNNTDSRVMDRKYAYLESNDGWLALQTAEDWVLLSRQGNLEPRRGYDSVKLINTNAALTFAEDKKKLTFNSGKEIPLTEHEIISFPNRPAYLMIKNKGALGLYNASGESVFDGKFDDLRFVNDTLLRISRKGKQGIINTKGEFVLNPIFNSLNERDGLIITLYKGAIGCYDASNNILIPPEYESRITKIGPNYLVEREGKYGIIDANQEQVLAFQYEEIEQWNDTSYLVSFDGKKSIINRSEEVLVNDLQRMQLISEKGEERIFKVLLDGKFGLISTQNDFVLKPEYTDIFSISNGDDLLFFADQHLSNAGFHVVSYLDSQGDLIFSKAYRKEEFDQIICDD